MRKTTTLFSPGANAPLTVANALPMLKEKADVVTERDHGAGVTQIVDELLEDDLKRYDARLVRHRVLLGYRENEPVYVVASRGSLLFAGPSGSGKSTAASGLIERAAECGYQYCIVDPEGDFEHFAGALSFGTAKAAPDVEELLRALASARQNVVINLLGIALADRPAFFAALLPRLIEMRMQVGRPHWIVVDETHHMLPTAWEPSGATLPPALGGMAYLTVHPENVSPVALASVDTLLAIGREPRETLESFARAMGEAAPRWSGGAVETGEALVWARRSNQPPFVIRTEPAKHEKRRHRRKYATGELPPERSFYFRGPEGKLNLRAQNLALFVQIAEGVDDETWLFHLRRGDYSAWFRQNIKDDLLAADAARVEKDPSVTANTSRQRVRTAIESRYTAAA